MNPERGKMLIGLTVALMLTGLSSGAESPQKPLEVLTKKAPAPTFAVYLPERIDTISPQYTNTFEGQHIVRAIVEKALLDDGHEILDIEMAPQEEGTNTPPATASTGSLLRKAAALKVTYLILGQATSFQMERSTWGGKGMAPGDANGGRQSAEISVRLLRVADGKILAVEEASDKGAARSEKAGAQGALREAAETLASRLIARINSLTR